MASLLLDDVEPHIPLDVATLLNNWHVYICTILYIRISSPKLSYNIPVPVLPRPICGGTYDIN